MYFLSYGIPITTKFQCCKFSGLICTCMYVCLQPLVPLPVARDAQRLEEILEYLRDEVKTRRILLHPYFRDFDKVVFLF